MVASYTTVDNVAIMHAHDLCLTKAAKSPTVSVALVIAQAAVTGTRAVAVTGIISHQSTDLSADPDSVPAEEEHEETQDQEKDGRTTNHRSNNYGIYNTECIGEA